MDICLTIVSTMHNHQEKQNFHQIYEASNLEVVTTSNATINSISTDYCTIYPTKIATQSIGRLLPVDTKISFILFNISFILVLFYFIFIDS